MKRLIFGSLIKIQGNLIFATCLLSSDGAINSFHQIFNILINFANKKIRQVNSYNLTKLKCVSCHTFYFYEIDDTSFMIKLCSPLQKIHFKNCSLFLNAHEDHQITLFCRIA